MTTLLDNQTQKTKHDLTDRQLKYLYLEAEIDLLLQRLTILKQHKQLSSELTSK